MKDEFLTKPLKTKVHSITKDYEIQREVVLGIGISGKVIRCKRKSDNCEFALKILEDSEKARREIEIHYICSRLSKYVVKIEDVYENFQNKQKCLLIVMEWMKGGELFDRIKNRHEPFTEQEVASIMYQIAHSVKDIHSINIAHRDIKPENYLYENKDIDSQLKLTDFGFAKFITSNHALQTPCYTPYYAAPEVVTGSGSYDKSCDMWSIGVLMLCGYPPFYSKSNVPLSPGMKAAILTGNYTFPDEDWKHISSTAKWIIDRLLCIEPTLRMKIEELCDQKWINLSFQNPTTPLGTTIVLKREKNWNELMDGLRQALSEMRPSPIPIMEIRDIPDGNDLLSRRKKDK